MTNLYIEKKNNSPEIDFDALSGVLNITGSCYLEYTLEFFKPLLDWIKAYTKDEGKIIVINFRLDHFNTSAARRFQEILEVLEYYKTEKKGNVTANWYYPKDHPEAKESGEDYSRDSKIPFNIIPY
jgi:hypothetical protein